MTDLAIVRDNRSGALGEMGEALGPEDGLRPVLHSPVNLA